MRSFKTQSLALALALFVPTLSSAQEDAGETIEVVGDTRPERPAMRPMMSEYDLVSQRFVFPTGLVVLMQPDHSEPLIGITTLFDKGSTSDPQGKEGIAHFLEHMWFQSHHGDLPKTWDVLAEIGCDLNASTADDWTNYMSVCPSNQLSTLMKLSSLRMTDPTTGVPPERIDSEREVIRNELRMRYENGGSSVLAYMNAALFPPDHPYARLGIGTHGSLDNIKYEDIVKFGEDHYRPENATITIVGDFDPQVASSLIFENFDLTLLHPDLTQDHLFKYPRPGIDSPDETNPEHWLWGAWDPATVDTDDKKPLDLSGEPPNRAEGVGMEPMPAYDQTVAEYDAPVDDRVVYLAWSVPGAYQGQDSMMTLAANVVGNYINLGLKQAAVPGVLDGSGCFALESKLNTKILCGIPIKDNARGDYIATKALDQIAPIWNPDLYMSLDNQLGTFQNAQLAQILGSLDRFSGIGPGSRATDIAHHAHYTGRAQYHSDAMEEVMTIKGQQIAQFAEKWLTRDRAAMIVLNPLPEDEITKDSSESDYAGASAENDTVTFTIDPKEVTPELIQTETALPNMSDMRDYKLGNGMRVVILPHGEAPIADVRIIAYGGEKTEPVGLGRLAWRFQTAYEFDARMIAGTSTAGGMGADSDSYQLTIPNGNLDGALWIMREHVETLKPYTAGKPDYIKRLRKGLVGNWNSVGWHVGQVRREHVLGAEHPMSYDYRYEDIETFQDWGASDIGGYLNSVWQPANVTLLIVGNVRPGEAETLASKYFSSWKPRAGVVEQQMPAITGDINPGESRVLLFDDERKTQTDVTLSCPGAPATSENTAARGVFGTLLSDDLFQYLRADLGVTYGAYGGIRTGPGGTSEITMGGLFQNDAVAVSVKAFQDALVRYESGDFDADAMQLVKLNQARKYVIRQQSSAQMAGRIGAVIEDRREWDHISKYPERLAAVDTDQIKALFGSCSDHVLITAVGPVDVMKPALDEAGIAYEVYDHEALADEWLEAADPKAYKKKKKDEAKAEKKKAKKGESDDEESEESEESEE
ncbi:MAG: insulinase family protein [Proteobacteria bacterium]|nr:insulinase family protein [Pseudomonadota bacterium]